MSAAAVYADPPATHEAGRGFVVAGEIMTALEVTSTSTDVPQSPRANNRWQPDAVAYSLGSSGPFP